jgi:hypothetical protein
VLDIVILAEISGVASGSLLGRAAGGRAAKARRLNPKGTQEEVARAAGVSRATVSRIERGDRRGGGRLLTPQF